MADSRTGSIVFSVLLTAAWVHAAVPDIGTRRELFVDDYLIETTSGCELRLHHPIPREVALVHDAPWEGNLSCYHTVFKDGDLYRMYYRGTQLDCARGSRKMHDDFTCYAESDDGIQWRKPELGIFEFNGSKKNNIILGGYPAHNFAPFLDPNPDCPTKHKYKAFGGHKKDPGHTRYGNTVQCPEKDEVPGVKDVGDQGDGDGACGQLGESPPDMAPLNPVSVGQGKPHADTDEKERNDESRKMKPVGVG